MTYQQFLKTAHWDRLRTMCLKRDCHRCQACGGSKHLQAHHRTYRRSWFRTKLKDLVTLCRWCHEGVHGGRIDGFMGKQAPPEPPKPSFVYVQPKTKGKDLQALAAARKAWLKQMQKQGLKV